MKYFLLISLFLGFVFSSLADEPAILLEEKFTTPLSKDWFWGLGTWIAKDGVLRGFESGPRRHGPVKLRKFAFKNAQVEYKFRITGKAVFAGIMFNGDKERGHIVHLVITKDIVRILGHPKKGVNVDLLKQDQKTAVGEWHQVKIIFEGQKMLVTLDGREFSANAPCVAEAKHNFGLGGESGGPEGEKAGALEFKDLKIRELN